MKRLRKSISFLVCLCISVYAMPGFAFTAPADSDFVKIELTDEAMQEAMGASGHVDATLADYNVAGGTAVAVFTNRTSVGCNYSLDAINSNGGVLEVLASGSLNAGESILISGTPTDPTQKYIQAKLIQPGFGAGWQSIDTSWAP